MFPRENHVNTIHLATAAAAAVQQQRPEVDIGYEIPIVLSPIERSLVISMSFPLPIRNDIVITRCLREDEKENEINERWRNFQLKLTSVFMFHK